MRSLGTVIEAAFTIKWYVTVALSTVAMLIIALPSLHKPPPPPPIADDEAFARTAKVSEEDAIKTAQDRFGGDVVEVEYEIESDGSPSYEIDLAQDGQDTEFKVEVDAVSGEIIELSVEQWQIGQEPDEKTAAAN